MFSSPDGHTIYISNRDSNTITEINALDNSILRTINVGSGPVSVGVTTDGNEIQVINQYSNSVSIISTSNFTTIKTVTGFNSPASLGIFVRPSTVPIADISGIPLSGDTPLTIQFMDDYYGVPTSWLWDFGDGSTTVNVTNPIHTYLHTGLYTVTLTVSNNAGYSVNTAYHYVNVTANGTVYSPPGMAVFNATYAIIPIFGLFLLLPFFLVISGIVNAVRTQKYKYLLFATSAAVVLFIVIVFGIVILSVMANS